MIIKSLKSSFITGWRETNVADLFSDNIQTDVGKVGRSNGEVESLKS